MKHRKESRSDQLFQATLKVIAMAFFCLLALAVYEANASDKDYRPTKVVVNKNTVDRTIDVDARGTANSDSSSNSDSNSFSEAESSASNGDQISSNQSQFYALSLMFPNATNCFVGAQGGAQDTDANSGTSGFLGLHYLNKSCWMDALAAQETDIELNAALRCHDKHYRAAIAYDVPRKQRRATCIERKVASGKAQMNEHRAQLDESIRQQDEARERLEQCHDRIDDANERTTRCVESVTK